MRVPTWYRIYERLKAEREAETAHREEEDFLVNLMREEEAAERDRAEAAARAARREAAKAEMIAANKMQMQLKVRNIISFADAIFTTAAARNLYFSRFSSWDSVTARCVPTHLARRRHLGDLN